MRLGDYSPYIGNDSDRLKLKLGLGSSELPQGAIGPQGRPGPQGTPGAPGRIEINYLPNEIADVNTIYYSTTHKRLVFKGSDGKIYALMLEEL